MINAGLLVFPDGDEVMLEYISEEAYKEFSKLETADDMTEWLEEDRSEHVLYKIFGQTFCEQSQEDIKEVQRYKIIGITTMPGW